MFGIDLRAVGWGQSHSASLRIVAVNNPIVYSNNPLAEGDLVGREVDLPPPLLERMEFLDPDCVSRGILPWGYLLVPGGRDLMARP